MAPRIHAWGPHPSSRKACAAPRQHFRMMARSSRQTRYTGQPTLRAEFIAARAGRNTTPAPPGTTMTAKQMLFDEDARRKIHDGARKLARVVKSTLGPSGHAVLLKRSIGGPLVCNDGVTVSKEVELPDPFENMGAKLVHEVCNKTNDVAGDGTTTACVLAEAILDEGMKVVAGGVNPIELGRGITRCTEAAIAAIRRMSRNVTNRTEVFQVGTIAANDDTVLGEIFADAFDKVGKDGVITVEEGKSTQTVLEFVQGYQFDQGYLSPYFVTDAQRMVAELDDPYVLCLDRKISNLREFLPLLEQTARASRPLLVISEAVEGEALTVLVLNRLQGVLAICAVKAPGFGDRRKAVLEDIAILTGGVALTADLGTRLEELTLDQLGSAKKVTVEKDSTTIVEGAGSEGALRQRAAAIRAQIDKATSKYDREKLEERHARLTGGVAVVRVGARTETEMKELKLRVDDALHATRAAVEEGILPGGGVAYLRAIDAVNKVDLRDDEEYGRRILIEALRRPTAQIARNAGQDGDLIVEGVLSRPGNVGFDARASEYVDMMERGIIDPTRVVCSALQNATSVAGLVLTSNTMITDYKNENGVPGAIH
ncbi:MAG: chaperonin GroEL [Planctomycetota bacterium]